MIPGINDAHVHAPWLEEQTTPLKVPRGATVQGLLEAVRDAAAAAPEGTWLTGSFPRPLLDAGVDRAVLDRAAPRHRVRLSLLGGHAVLLNGQALRALGIAEGAENPPGGEYGRAGDRLDGWVYEHALWNPMRALTADVSDAVSVTALRAFEDEAISLGITSVQTMPLVDAGRTERLLAQLGPRLRWRVIAFQFAPLDDRTPARAVKYVLDGTPIERGAARLVPYADQPSTRGRLNYTPTEIEEMVRRAAEGAQPLLLHAVGDRAIEEVLSAMERQPQVPWRERRVRLEHADQISPAQAARAAALGMLVVQNPSHFNFPDVMTARYGEAAAHANAPVKSLLAAGLPVALGSDGPLNPFLNVMFAAGHPNAAEALSREEALIAYTQTAALAEFEETRKGRLTEGMLADLAVLSQDLFTVPADQLPAVRSLLTVVGGRVVWDRLTAP